jgi:hypothetical protein
LATLSITILDSILDYFWTLGNREESKSACRSHRQRTGEKGPIENPLQARTRKLWHYPSPTLRKVDCPLHRPPERPREPFPSAGRLPRPTIRSDRLKKIRFG